MIVLTHSRQTADQTALLVRHIAQRHTPVTSISSLLAIGMMLGSGGAQAAAVALPVPVDIQVTSLADTGAVCTLRNAIALAATNPASGTTDSNTCAATTGTASTNSISFASTVTGTITLNGSQIGITAPITINGPGASVLSVSGNNATRIFGIGNYAATTINGLTLTGGKSGGSGGAITSNSNLTLTNSTVSGNTASDYGGGMRVINNSTVTLTNSTVSGNNAGYGGGGLYVNGGTTTLTNSTVSGNTANDYGGGLYLQRGTATLTNSTVSGNTTTARSGGGLFVTDSAVTLTNSTVSGNTASQNGGGLFVTFYGTATLTNSTVSGNTASSGGGLYVAYSSDYSDYLSTATLNNSIITSSSSPACVSTSTTPVAGSNNLITDTSCGAAILAGGKATTLAALNLGALANYGGPTQTIALLIGSAALGAGDAMTCMGVPVNNLDQRGTTRPNPCSVGAFDVPTPITFPDINGSTVSVTTDAGTLSTPTAETPPTDVPPGLTFPNGFFSYKITGLAVGGTAHVTFTLPAGSTPNAAVKCGTTCSVFPDAVFNGNTVTLTLVDGGAGDNDVGPPDGTITDPVGFSGSSSGASASSIVGGFFNLWSALILGLFGFGKRLRRRSVK